MNTPKSIKRTCRDISKTPNYHSQYINPSRIVPDLWKIGNIIALFKNGDKSDPGNYRPVSLTSVVGKLMEKIVRKVIVNHMIKKGVYSKTIWIYIREINHNTVAVSYRRMD